MALGLTRSCVCLASISILAACAQSASPPTLNSAAQFPPLDSARQASFDLPSVSRVQSGANPARPGLPWMGRTTAQGALLYVTDSSKWLVNIYNYPADTLSGNFSVEHGPAGECLDGAGNVYVTAQGASETLEFAPGGTQPIARFKSARTFEPVSCAVDPITGDLAVANIASGLSQNLEPGDISVFKIGHDRKGQVKRERFKAANLYSYYFLAYDNAGNLFVDGSSGRPNINVRFEYAELVKRHKQLTPITLQGGSVVFPGNVQWDGTHIDIGDQDSAVIYQTSGANIVGSTPLTGSSDVVGYFIDGGTVICPDAGNGTVEFYNYPAGGAPTGQITGFTQPIGAVVTQ